MLYSNYTLLLPNIVYVIFTISTLLVQSGLLIDLVRRVRGRILCDRSLLDLVVFDWSAEPRHVSPRVVTPGVGHQLGRTPVSSRSLSARLSSLPVSECPAGNLHCADHESQASQDKDSSNNNQRFDG